MNVGCVCMYVLVCVCFLDITYLMRFDSSLQLLLLFVFSLDPFKMRPSFVVLPKNSQIGDVLNG